MTKEQAQAQARARAQAQALAKAKAKAAAAQKYTKMLTAEQAMSKLTAGTNTGIADTLTNPLYSTVELTTGETTYYPFSKKKGQDGLTLVDTNVQEGGLVPAKQWWDVYDISASIYTPIALSDAQLQDVSDFLFHSVLTVEIDSSPKLEITLSDLMDMKTLTQAVSAVGTNSLQNTCFSGCFKLKNTLIMAAQTSFNFTITNQSGAGTPAALEGAEFRLTLGRDLVRLV